jgi:4-amino-4-deoxy-L-arabinose transferase-like glycosyltransferase
MKADLRDSEPQLKQSPARIPAWIYALGVFVLALVPRVVSLATIITPDESRWVERSVSFFEGLLRGNWSQTFQTGHPGVTTMWTGTAGLWGKYLLQHPPVALPDYLARVQTSPSASPEYLAATRLPTVILTAMAVAAGYLLVRRLLGNVTALLGAGLLALDPFYLAHSRLIHHDALATTFAFLAVLTFVSFAWRDRSWIWLVLSALCTALACLSKSSALFLLPFVGLAGLAALCLELRSEPSRRWETVRFWIIRLLLWSAIVAIFFVTLWPAMWVNPIGVTQNMLGTAIQYAEEPHARGSFFLGAPVDDPGFLFYPMVLLLRTTPLSLVGLLCCIVLIAMQVRRRHLLERPEVMALVTLLAFVVLFAAFMSFGSKKFDRYLLPIFPIVDFLAAAAFAQMLRTIASVKVPAALIGGISAAILIIQGLLLLPAYPYYLSAYNLLAGGSPMAQKVLLVGWGEGLEQAAAYLNERPDAKRLKVATLYYRDIRAFFKGKGVNFVADDDPKQPAAWNKADYVVAYVSQVQRQMPNLATVRYFQSLTPEFTFVQNGIPYVQVYKTPANVPPGLLLKDPHDQEQ